MPTIHPSHQKLVQDSQPITGPRNWSTIGTFHWRRFTADAVCWWVAIAIGAMIRYDSLGPGIPWGMVTLIMLAATVLQLILGIILRVYLGRHPWGSFEGLLDVVATTIIVASMLWIAIVLSPESLHVPRRLILIASPFAIIFMAGTRYMWRLSRQRWAKDRDAAMVPVVIYGAGYVGDTVARLLSTDRKSALFPVAMLDDAPSKRHLRLHGVNVMGTLKDLPLVVAKTEAQYIVVAIGDPSVELLQKVQDQATKSGVRVLVMPGSETMLRSGISSSDLRKLDIEDLLGRDQVDTDVSAIAGYLNGKTVLVTGAGGSIGQQLCVEINKHGPGELILLDRDETGLQGTDILIKGNGLLDTNEVVLADIRDGDQIKKIFNERKPDVIFHAAALKHLPMLEQYPDEAWKTNVLGTLNVLEAARESGVQTLINISTDKAANPTSILGLSKRVAERLTSWAGNEDNLRYLSVRFGNVIGSRGSMLPIFRELIEQGRPLTVTHPDITRYFMTIPEACQLVLQAGAIGRVGEVLILDMGEPVRILDIAQKMIDMSGKNVEIRFTGLREGEKLHEDLRNDFEVETNPFHPKISHAAVVGLSSEELSKEQWDAVVEVDPKERVRTIRVIQAVNQDLSELVLVSEESVL